MMPQQLPDICADKGVQQEVREAVKARLKFVSVETDAFTMPLENALYYAMMDGMRRGFAYGWRLGQNAITDKRSTQ